MPIGETAYLGKPMAFEFRSIQRFSERAGFPKSVLEVEVRHKGKSGTRSSGVPTIIFSGSSNGFNESGGRATLRASQVGGRDALRTRCARPTYFLTRPSLRRE